MRVRYTDTPPPWERISLETLTSERAVIYLHVPLMGRPIPIKVALFPMDYTILGWEDVAEAVTRIWLYRAGGPSGMKAKQPRMWNRAAKREENPKPCNWGSVVAIIQAASRGRELVVLCAWQMVVMIPNGGGTNFWGVGLVEVL